MGSSNKSNVPGTFQVLDHMSKEMAENQGGDKISYDITRGHNELQLELAILLFKDLYLQFESIPFDMGVSDEILNGMRQMVFQNLSRRDFLNDPEALAKSIAHILMQIYGGNPHFSKIIMQLETACDELWQEQGAQYRMKNIEELSILIGRILDKQI